MKPKWIWLWYAWCIVSLYPVLVAPSLVDAVYTLLFCVVAYILLPWTLWKVVTWVRGKVTGDRG